MTYKFHTWLKVEHWYHLFVAQDATGVVVSHSLMRPTINAPNGGIVSGHPHFNSILSLGFDLLGLALLGVVLYKITKVF